VSFLARIVVRWAVNVAALWIAVKLFDNVTASDWGALAVAGLVFAVVNTFIRPIAILLSLPFIILTLGVFFFFVNMAMLWITDWLVGGFDIRGFWAYVGTTIVVWVVNTVVEAVRRRD
jgi:putative membrane protein